MTEITIAGKPVQLREPTMGDVQRVVQCQNQQLAKLLQKKKFDSRTPIETALADLMTSDPETMAEFLTSQRTGEPVMTVMLAAGCTEQEAMTVKAKDIRVCKEFLGGTASDFLRELGIDIRTAPPQQTAAGKDSA